MAKLAAEEAAHNRGLIEGRVAGLAKDDGEKKTYPEDLRKLTITSTANGSARSDDWGERMCAGQIQITYAIDLATAARKHGIIAIG